MPTALLSCAQTESELAEKIERVKKRRRESAKRSRSRKNTYVQDLEVSGLHVAWIDARQPMR